MEYRKQLNINAKCFEPIKSDYSDDFKQFFEYLFTSWSEANIEMIISDVRIYSKEELEKFFKEMFINIYDISSKSEISLKAANAIETINLLDMTIPELLLDNYSWEDFIKFYKIIKRTSYKECFNRLKIACHLLHETNSNYILQEINNVCLILSKLKGMLYSDIYVHDYSAFLWEMISNYETDNRLREIFMRSLLEISDKLVMFLLHQIDKTDSTDDELELRCGLAVNIFRELKQHLIDCRFSSNEIMFVLDILDRHNRFIGQYHDAVPENIFRNGFIVSSSQLTCLENDDVYEDLEKFLDERIVI